MARRMWVIAAIALLAFLAWRWNEDRRRPAPPAVTPDSAAAGVRTVRLYFGAADGGALAGEVRELPEQHGIHDRVAALVAALDQGPAAEGAVAVLPAGTAALHVYLDDQGLLTLDLSRAFVQGFRGGSTAEWAAIASLVRTLGENLPEVKRVQIVAGGSAVRSLGGHLALDRPLTVSDW